MSAPDPRVVRMSNATPPGWYPDVGNPGAERWWDGTAWTAHTRPAAATQQLGYVSPQAGTVYVPPQRSGSAKRGGGGARIVAITLSALVAVGAAVTGFVLLGKDDPGAGTRPTSAPTSAPAPTDTGDGATGGDAPADDPKVLVDQLNGISLPVPDGWEKPESTIDDATTMRTVDAYTCPGDSGSYCYHGTVTSRTASNTDLTSAEALAKADISTAADKAYEENIVGDLIHGGIRSHKVLRSTAVNVAGRTGYLVRWRVTTGKGSGGYVQSLAFPSAMGSESPVLVRFAFDAGRTELPLSLMDTITRGIRPLDDSATSAGVGSSVAP